MPTTNIDRSLDDIIKDQRKLKKRTLKLKTQQTQKKGAQQRQGKKQTRGTAPNQNRGRRMAGKLNAQQGLKGTQRRRSGKQNQMGQQERGTQNYRKKQTTGDANRGKPGGARVTANRLKNKQGSTQKSQGKKIISKAKQIQQNRRTFNRQNRQTQQKDARQNILNKRRGMQGTPKGNRPNRAQNARNLSNKKSSNSKLQRINRRGNPAPQLTVSINNPRVRLTRTPQWTQASNQGNNKTNRRRWRGGFGKGGGKMDTGDLRISVPNNLHRPATLPPHRPLYYTGSEPSLEHSTPGKAHSLLPKVNSGKTWAQRRATSQYSSASHHIMASLEHLRPSMKGFPAFHSEESGRLL